jgi:copper transport protein
VTPVPGYGPARPIRTRAAAPARSGGAVLRRLPGAVLRRLPGAVLRRLPGAARHRRARLATLAGCLLAAAVLPLFGAAPAGAHAYLVSTDPPDGKVLPAGPARVTLTFTEAVDLGPGQLRVFSPDCGRVEAGRPRHADAARRTAAVDLRPGLGRGTYTVVWLVVSTDSHPVRGAFTFSVGAPSVSAPVHDQAAAGDPAVGVLLGTVRWVGFAGFALLVGVAAFLLLCWPAGAAVPAVRRLAVGGWAALAAATAAHAVLQGPYTAGLSLRHVLDPDLLAATAGTRLGHALMVRAGLLGLLGALGPWMLGRLGAASGRPRLLLGAGAAAGAAVLAATWSAADHASTGGQVALALPANVVHLVAMATWLGGLVVLAAVALGRPDRAVLDAAVPRFSRLALGCVTALAATGAFQAWRQAGGPAALLGTEYGRILLVKLGIVAALVFVAWISRQWVQTLAAAAAQRRSGGPGGVGVTTEAAAGAAGLRRTVTAETVLGALALAVTALLVGTVPARDAEAVPPEADVAQLVNGAAEFRTGPGRDGRGSVTVFLDPGRVGINVLRVTVWDDRNAPRAVPEVRATLSLPERQLGPLPVKLAATGPGQYLAPAFALPAAGEWKLAVAVRTSDIDESTVEFPLRVR